MGMLSRPANWDQIEGAEFGGGGRLPPGPYSCRIANAYEKISKSGKQMLVLEMDVDSGEYADFFGSKGKSAAYYQLTEGDSVRFFKGLITAIEKSNDGYRFDFNPKSLIGRRCCAVFREEEFYGNNGDVAVSSKIWYVTSLQRMAEGIEPPKPKKLENSAAAAQGAVVPASSFAAAPAAPDYDDSDLPF